MSIEDSSPNKSTGIQPKIPDKPLQNQAYLEQLYYGKGLTQKEIANRPEFPADCTPRKVRYWMKKHGIEPGAEMAHERAKQARTANYAGYRTNTDGYEEWHLRDGRDEDGDSVWQKVKVHQLLAIANGADPHKVFGGFDVHHPKDIPWLNMDDEIDVIPHWLHSIIHSGEKQRDARGRFVAAD